MAGSNDARLREMGQPPSFRYTSESEFSFGAPGATSSLIDDAPPYRPRPPPPPELRRPNIKGSDGIVPPPPPPSRNGSPSARRPLGAIPRRSSPAKQTNEQGAIGRPPMSRIQDGYRTPRRSSYTGDSSDTETETDTKPRSQRMPKLKSRKSPNTSHDSSHTETESRNDGYTADEEPRLGGSRLNPR